MEYQGIITGIGGKELGKNLIKPEYDAVINDFIIGKNTILEGLVLNGNNLSAGTCILCGYRGIIEESKTLDITTYVYGEFTLNFNSEIEDSFNIVTSTTALTENVNPTEITSAGTYYLLLYINGEKQVDLVDENGITKEVGEYPLKSYYSVETENVLDNAVISETATTPTSLNELGEIVTDLHIAQPNRVVNTEYAHAQIEREIDYDTVNIGVIDSENNNVVGSIELKRKAKYVIGKITITKSLSSIYSVIKPFKIPNGYVPAQDVKIALLTQYYASGEYTRVARFLEIKSGQTSQTQVQVVADVIGTQTSMTFPFYCTFGYQCR